MLTQWPLRPRFLGSALATFLAVVVILAGAGYAAIEMTVRQPRDPFRAGSFEFDLAPGWWCELDGTEYVCIPPVKAPYPAIAIIAIKERNKDDNLQTYEDHLKQSQHLTDGSTSAVLNVGRVKLGHAEWVESLHRGSEVPNFDTYYLATNNSYLGILVTMSVHKDYEKIYVRQLDEMMSTLNLYQR
jgi:hypothetical protein